MSQSPRESLQSSAARFGSTVAVVDSGIDAGHPWFRGATITSVGIESGRRRTVDLPCNDDFGHGTACAAIIHRKARVSRIVSVKVLGRDRACGIDDLVAGIEASVARGAKIINLSLGALSGRHADTLEDAARWAAKQGTYIISAAHDQTDDGFPASCPSVIAVGSASCREKYEYLFGGSGKVKAYARGDHQRVAWTSPRFIFAHGSSFAAAHISGVASILCDWHEPTGLEELRSLLERYASGEPREQQASRAQSTKTRLFDGELDPLRVVLYPYTKEMHAILRFRQQLGFEIVAVCDVRYRATKDTDPGVAAGIEDTGLSVSYDLREALRSADTLVLSKTNELGAILGKDLVHDALYAACEAKVDVFSITYVDRDSYPDLEEIVDRSGISIKHPVVTKEDLADSIRVIESHGHIGNSIPVLAVLGTGRNQGKFTLQLSLRHEFQRRGYTVRHLATETHAELFGAESIVPLEEPESLQIPFDDFIPFVQGKVRALELSSPDVILIGGQSGFIPRSYGVRSNLYTLPSIALLMATLPHAVILVVNPSDDHQYVQRTIDAIQAVGQARVIALAVCRKAIRERGGDWISEPVSSDETAVIAGSLAEVFSRPVFDFADPAELRRMSQTVIDYYSS